MEVKKVKMVSALTALVLLTLVSVGQAAPTIIMDATINNGSFTFGTGEGGNTAVGYWNSTPTAVPTGWVETSVNMYTTGSRWIQAGSVAEAVNNTGLQVQAGHAYTVSADLGGQTGNLALVRVYATQNADGTGDKMLLVEVTRPGNTADGYTLFPVSHTGTGIPSTVAGYYVQVVIGGPYAYFNHYIAGYYDNIIVTSEPATSMMYMNSTLHNGDFESETAGFWDSTPSAIPYGWKYISGSPYTTGTRFIQAGSAGDGVNNTGELVLANHAYTVSADLGGGTGVDAWVRVYATENSDGTGNKVLLASVNRVGLATDGAYDVYNTVGTPGSPAPSTLAGYYVQVRIGGPWADFGHYISGNYDNIVVTSERSPITTYMSPDFHNGSLTADAAGYWNVSASCPTGWIQTANEIYSTASMWAQCGSTGEAVNNTGELVEAGQAFTVSADLGGGDGTDATVRVYATKNIDGTGNRVELASVHRVGQLGDGYTLFNVVGTPGATVPANLDGYYVQVAIGGPYVNHYISGNYDNIVVTSEEGQAITTIKYMDAVLHNGAMNSQYASGGWTEDPGYVPFEWTTIDPNADPNHIWTAALGFILFDGLVQGAINNTGEIVPAGHQFTIQASLGGMTGALAKAFAYATENIDGTGVKVLLAEVSRPGNDANGYSLFTVTGTPGSMTSPSLTGYYVQVMLKTIGDPNLNGYYDNIVVTSEAAGGAVCGDAEHDYPIGDLSQDCYVDSQDLEMFAGQWMAINCAAPGWCGGADLNQQAKVDLQDFAVLASNWLDCTDPELPCSYNP